MDNLTEIFELLANPKELSKRAKLIADERSKLDAAVKAYGGVSKIKDAEARAERIVAEAQSDAEKIIAEANAYKANQVAGFDRRVEQHEKSVRIFEEREQMRQAELTRGLQELGDKEKEVNALAEECQMRATQLDAKETRLEKKAAEVDARVKALKEAQKALA